MKKIITTLLFLQLVFSFKGNCSTMYSLDVVVYGSPTTAGEYNSTGYNINANPWEYNFCGATPSIAIAIIDSITCEPVNNCNHQFGQANIFNDFNGDCISDGATITTCRTRPENYFIFRSNDSNSMLAMAHLLDSIGNGNFIVAYSMFPMAYSAMDTSFRNVFQRLNSAMIPTLADNLPFIFFCKKGDPGSVQETSGAFFNSVINLNVIYQCSSTGVGETLMNNQLHIYPNPVSDELNIEPGNHNAVRISVYDGLGRLAMEKSCEKNSETINVKNLAAGFYYVKVEGDNFNSAAKVCVMHE